MLKISEAKSVQDCVTLHLEGTLAGPWVAELRDLCEPLARDGSKVALDMTEVSFADEAGVDLLAKLSRRGMRLLSPTPFLREQLKSVLSA